MKTITGETDQSGVVRHTVERDGEDVTISVRRECATARLNRDLAVNITREHARQRGFVRDAVQQAIDECTRDLDSVLEKILNEIAGKKERK